MKLTLALACLYANPAQAVHCTVTGHVTVAKATDGNGFTFYPSPRSHGDIFFSIPGKNFHLDTDSRSGEIQFFIDGIHYEFLATKKYEFTEGDKDSDDANILTRHAIYEYQFAQSVGSYLTEFKDLGNREKPASQSNPKFVFKLWGLKNPKEPDGARQYYLTTVVGDEVAVLSTIIKDTSFDAQAMAAFNMFASSFQYISSDQDCPLATYNTEFKH